MTYKYEKSSLFKAPNPSYKNIGSVKASEDLVRCYFTYRPYGWDDQQLYRIESIEVEVFDYLRPDELTLEVMVIGGFNQLLTGTLSVERGEMFPLVEVEGIDGLLITRDKEPCD